MSGGAVITRNGNFGVDDLFMSGVAGVPTYDVYVMAGRGRERSTRAVTALEFEAHQRFYL